MMRLSILWRFPLTLIAFFSKTLPLLHSGIAVPLLLILLGGGVAFFAGVAFAGAAFAGVAFFANGFSFLVLFLGSGVFSRLRFAEGGGDLAGVFLGASFFADGFLAGDFAFAISVFPC